MIRDAAHGRESYLGAAPGRNDPCPCGSGRKYKHCCLARVETGESARQRMRAAEARVTDLLDWAMEDWGGEFLGEAWGEFFDWEDVPDYSPRHPDFEGLFLPWFVLRFVVDRDEDDLFSAQWPREPVALHYVHTRPDAFSEFERRFLTEAVASPSSFWAVTGVEPGRAIDLENVLTGETCTVLEQSASKTVVRGALLFARVLTLDGVSIQVGCGPLLIPPTYRRELIQLREEVAGRHGRIAPQDLWDHDTDLRVWYHDVAEALRNPPLPVLQNTDGEPLAPTTMHFELRCAPAEAFGRLKSLNRVVGDEDVLLGDGEAAYDADGSLRSVEIAWMKPGNRLHKHWDNTVLGRVTIDGATLVATANSATRARKLRREIEKRLGDRVEHQRSVVESVERLLEDARARAASGGVRQARDETSTPEEQEAMNEMMRRHWEQWLDVRIPALGNRTPRQAAKSPAGRELLEALFAEYEWRGERQPAHLRAPVAELRARLGLS